MCIFVGDPSQITLTLSEKFCFGMLDLANRRGWQLYITTKKCLATVHIRKGYKSKIWEESCIQGSSQNELLVLNPIYKKLFVKMISLARP